MKLCPQVLPVVLGLVFACSAAVTAADDPTGSGSSKPRELGIREHVKRRLVQLDVTVSGPRNVIPHLTAGDFELYVGNVTLGGRRVEDLTLDRFCPAPEPRRPETPAARPRKREEPPPRASYVFYFDRTISYFAFHEETHEMVRELIDRLVDERSPATIVSGGRTIRTYAFNTFDREELFSALERLALDASELDHQVWYPHVGLWDVREALQWSTRPQVFAREHAYRYQKNAIEMNYLALTRLSAVMPGLSDLPLPKVLFYIGNGLNSRPGQILFDAYGKPLDALSIGDTDPWAAAEDFERVIHDAATAGVRIYPIFPAGPTHSLDFKHMQALRASHSSMHALAVQTGGQEFFWGVPVTKIVKKLKTDLSCVYLLSFDPRDLSEDRRLGVQLRVNLPKVKAVTRKQIVVRGSGQQREAELLAAFLADAHDTLESGLSAEIVSPEVEGGEVGIVRITLPASGRDGSTWRLGVWVARDGVVDRRIVEQATAQSTERPVVVEYPMRFKPGPMELIVVAHEPDGERVLSRRFAVTWPGVASRP